MTRAHSGPFEATEFRDASAAEVRAAIRAGQWSGPTAGLGRGYAQANLVVLPADYADDFERFCQQNPRPCPLLLRTSPGDPVPHGLAADADLRTDVPKYRVFREGIADSLQPSDIASLWCDDLVSFLIGCSFTFESALVAAGLPVRHIDQGRNVPMYRTRIACASAGPFAGPLVVSMRPYPAEQIADVIRITAEFPTMHGAPIHIGDPAALGVDDLSRPDFGDAVTIDECELPVFWACGVTPQLALAAARPPICITHSPGCMFITDRTDASFRQPTRENAE
ncbi:MAG: putative hydro-lyase [Pirellulales bacterium]|nr:putative hydro-lyase [Pirellulales bacterium]